MKKTTETDAPKKEPARKSSFFKLDLAVLAALYQEDCYGYQILTILKEQTHGLLTIREGVLYPILYRLNKEGKVSTDDRMVKKRSRIYYHLEPDGLVYLKQLLKEYIDGQRTINNYLIWTGCMNPDQCQGLVKENPQSQDSAQNLTD